MQWHKLGNIYDPTTISNRHEKLISHAANPLPIHLKNDVYRVFYSGRDKDNRSSVGAVDIDIVQMKVIQDHHEPIIVHGDKDCFFSHGVSIGNHYTVQNKTYILFMGWHIANNQHWRGEIGRLVLNDDLTVTLDRDTPFIGIDDIDNISLSYPWVIEHDTNFYKMWYGSTLTWDAGNNEMVHVLNYANSSDGNKWKKEGLAIPYEIGLAQAFSRPTVIRNEQEYYEMWFSYRSGKGEKYHIGYAKSEDGLNWQRDDKNFHLNTSLYGWDSEMVEYPYVMKHAGKTYMFYNGNGYGKTGFGLAVLK